MKSKQTRLNQYRNYLKWDVKSVLSIFVILGFICYQYYYDPIVESASPQKEKVLLSECTDGDTAKFIIDGEKTSVRFLAVDTPESVKPGVTVEPYALAAKERTCDILSSSKEIELEYDKDKKDKYGRTLAWIWADEELVQLKLVNEGLARVEYLYDQYKHTSIVLSAEKEAQEARRGIWNR